MTSLTLPYRYFKHYFKFVNDYCEIILVLDKAFLIHVELFDPPQVNLL